MQLGSWIPPAGAMGVCQAITDVRATLASMARLFAAVWPPAAVVDQLGITPRPDVPGVRVVAPAQWHVTLRFFGEADPAEVQAGLDRARLPAATAVLGPAVRRLGKSTVVVPAAGLDSLAEAVRDATGDVGEPPGSRPFHGHLTIARLRRGAKCELVGTAVALEFRVEEVVLVHSTLTRDGARYAVIRRWPTRESA